MAADTGGCDISYADRANRVNFFAMRLHHHDPLHAAQMTQVASDIIYGYVGELKSALGAGLSANALFNLTGDSTGNMSLLTLAASVCNYQIVQLLVSSGASVDGAEGFQRPLVVAAAKDDTATEEFLIQHGANVDRVDGMGHSALEDAVRQNRSKSVQLLLSLGANPNKSVGPGTIFDLVAGSSDATSQAIAQMLTASGAKSGLAPQH